MEIYRTTSKKDVLAKHEELFISQPATLFKIYQIKSTKEFIIIKSS